MKKNIFSQLLIAGMFLLLITTSCQKEETQTAPMLPPETSMIMDFSDFVATKTGASTTHINKAVAVTHVAIWNTVIFVHMAVPVATFREAFNQSPQLQPDGKWKWSYSVNVGNDTYTSNLYGQINGANVNWEMYISRSGLFAFDNFLWYTGTSLLNGGSGTWTLYHSAANPTPYVGIDWYKNSDDTFGITYTNIVPDGQENGGYISHGRNNEINFNAFYEIYNKGENNLVKINWNTETKAGQISDPKVFGTSDFQCWAPDGTNTACE